MGSRSKIKNTRQLATEPGEGTFGIEIYIFVDVVRVKDFQQVPAVPADGDV